ncbi:MAG: phosphodiester glycosidase family protein [Clostridia bacterium]
MKRKRLLRWAFCLLMVMIAMPRSLVRAEDESEDSDINRSGVEIVVTAAEAAEVLRAANRAADNAEMMELQSYDLTQNGVVNDIDVRVALWAAAGRIPDLVKFVERVTTGLLDETAFDRFRYADVYDDGQGNYQSSSVSVTVTEYMLERNVYFVADIYIQDIRCLATAIPGKSSGRDGYVETMARENNAVLAINGDYYTQRMQGPIIRNGETIVPNVSAAWDVGVLTWTGELKTFPYRTLTKELLTELNPYQTWVFGPVLLDETGQPATKFNSAVTPSNPRAVIGYYSPGHYCFILVDGRQSKYSVGMTMKELAALCAEMGLKTAYNLDGGQSAAMATRNGLISRPYGGGRAVSDIIYIRELPEDLPA